jgi:hypothetical protein
MCIVYSQKVMFSTTAAFCLDSWLIEWFPAPKSVCATSRTRKAQPIHCARHTDSDQSVEGLAVHCLRERQTLFDLSPHVDQDKPTVLLASCELLVRITLSPEWKEAAIDPT